MGDKAVDSPVADAAQSAVGVRGCGMLALLLAAATLSGQEVRAKGGEAFRPEAAWVVEYKPGEARCAGQPVRRREGERIWPALNWFEGEIPAEPVAPVLETRFDIASDGRPVSIRVHWVNNDALSVPARTAHVESVLVGWRFEPGRGARQDCLLPMEVTATPIAKAPRQLRLQTMGVNRSQFGTTQEVSPQRDLGDTCRDIKPRTVSYPDFEPFKPKPGGRKWAVVAFDVDAGGAPAFVRVEASSGDPGVDAAAVRAVTESRFQPGEALKGCLGTFEVDGDSVPPPSLPTDRPAGPAGRCRGAPPNFVRYTGSPTYPYEMQQRGIEGRALIRFDVSPEGRVINSEIAAAEPSTSFGQEALAYIRKRSAAPSPDGYQGCLAPIVFQLED